MLKLKPSCEHCNRSLPADSLEAMICSYECTYCQSCVSDILHNVCPNCGGGFSPRPHRPQQARRDGVSLQHHPASTEVVHRPVDVQAHAEFAEKVKDIPSQQR